MKKKLALLLLSAGRRVALMECFRNDAAALGIDLRVLAADAKPELSAACALANSAHAAPRCTEPEYESFVLQLCKQEGIDLVVPTIDTELLALARIPDALARQGTRALISSEAVVLLARDKLRTAEVLSSAGIRTPRTVSLDKFDRDDPAWAWPLFVKPRAGSSSMGVNVITYDQANALPREADLVVQERLVGAEYTVNIFFDRGGALKAVIPHLRIETRAGEVSKADTVRSAAIENIGWALQGVLDGARGPLCFQLIDQPDRGPVVFEINARFGGGYPIAHHAGAAFTKWLIEEEAGLPSSTNNEWRDGVRMLRYDAAVFR